MGKKEDYKLSIIIIPPTDKVKKLIIPRWLPKVTAISILTLTLIVILSVLGIYTSHNNLKEEYNTKISEIDILKEENKNKDEKINELESQREELYKKSIEIENKLLEIDKLQKQLETMAGIEDSSRGSSLAGRFNIERLNSVEDLNLLEETLEDKEEELKVFIDDLKDRFEYLKTVPDQWPTYGRITSRFGDRKDPIRGRSDFHDGIDIANSLGTDVRAAGKGVVKFSSYKSGYGRLIVIDHGNGYKTLYAHNSKLLVNVGDKVEKGQIIAKMGSTGRSTGSHLHFEIHLNGKPINPLTILK